jgi:hypothetical protein
MKKLYFIMGTLALGCIIAFLITRISNLCLLMLPIAAFGVGYFSSRKMAVLCGFFLIASSSLTLSLEESRVTAFFLFPFTTPLPYVYVINALIGCFGIVMTGFLSSTLRQNTKKWKFISVFFIVIALLWFGYQSLYGFVPSIKIENAYCVYNESSESPGIELKFSLNNLAIMKTGVSYTWSLNDPMADFSNFRNPIGNPKAGIFRGQGQISLPALESQSVIINLNQAGYMDPRFYVMYVNLHQGNRLIGYYREQKSTYDWDYSATPPVKKSANTPYTSVYVDTIIRETDEGYRADIGDIVIIPPAATPALSLKNVGIDFKSKNLVPLRLFNKVTPDHTSPFGIVYYDLDADGTVSRDDYFTMNAQAKDQELSFISWNDPRLSFYQIVFSEKVEDENPTAIQIHSLEYFPKSRESGLLRLKISSNNTLRVTILSTAVGSRMSLKPTAVQGNTSIYENKLNFYVPEKKSNYLILVITDGINEVVRLLDQPN